MRLIDYLWMLEPAFSHEHFHVSWMHLAGLIALGGFWFWMFTRELGRRALIPINDPQYESVLEQAHAGH
jgi:hypothetical protein